MEERRQADIEEVFKNHYKEFYLLSYSYVSCPYLAQDVVHEIFAQILANDGTKILNLKGYIWRAIKLLSLKQVERSRKLVSFSDTISVLSSQEHVEENCPPIELWPKLRSSINSLPEQCKKVFELCALDGQKYKSAADSLGISVNTVKTQMKKAYKILRSDLGNTYFFILIFEIIHNFLS